MENRGHLEDRELTVQGMTQGLPSLPCLLPFNSQQFKNRGSEHNQGLGSVFKVPDVR